jgi:hypothetical protein
MRRGLFILAAAALAATACSSTRSDNSTVATPPSTRPTSTTSTSSTTPLAGVSTTPVSTPIAGHAKLTAVTVTNQGGFDRITYTFTGGLPGYAVAYIQRPVQEDASGKTVAVKGDNVLQMRFAGASGVDLSGGKMTQTYTGPRDLTPGTPVVAELVRTGDFEDVLTWVAGTTGRPGFKVGTDAAAGTITVDVAHP